MSPTASLQVRLLGELEVLHGGVPVELPRSKKTRALCAYLVATQRAQRRERLATLLWDAAEDGRGGLRWSVSKLRKLLDAQDLERVVADKDTLEFRPRGAWVDVDALRGALGHGSDGLGAEALEELVALFRGPFLDGLDQPEQHGYQSWCLAERERWRATHVRLLDALIERYASTPAAALTHARELVRLAPDERACWSTLLGVLVRAGHRAEAEEQFRLALHHLRPRGPLVLHELREGYRALLATTPAPPCEALPRPALPVATDAPPRRQRVQFCRAHDGVRIAYATVGSGPPLLKTANWMNHLEYDWKSPIWRHLAGELSERYTLVRYDQRGNGLSDWNVERFSFEAFVSDLESVVEAAGLSRFPVLGISQGCAHAVEYAARHPERVTKLVLYGGFARGWRHRAPEEVEARLAMMTLVRQGWGKDNPAFRQLFSSLFMPDASPEEFRQFNELQRVSCSPQNAISIMEANSGLDVTERLEHVRAPTLVLHSTDDARIPFEAGRALAAGIPGARFVALESRNHLLLSHEPAWLHFMTEVEAFLAEG